MAISKKGSRNISVDGHGFKWRATGNDGWISVVVWPVSNEDFRVVASIEYHHNMLEVGEDHYTSQSQLVVTNRIVREIILHVGIERMLENRGQLDIGRIEDFYDVADALRS